NSAICRVEILTPISAESLRKTRKEFSVGPGNLRICDRFGRRDLDEKLAQSHAPTARTTTDPVTQNDGPRTGRARIESLPTRLGFGIGWPRCRDVRPVVSLKSGNCCSGKYFHCSLPRRRRRDPFLAIRIHLDFESTSFNLTYVLAARSSL